MPTERPSNAPDGPAALDAVEDATAGAILADERLDTTPGGGGLGGSAAAEALGGADHAGGTTAATPIDTGISHDGDPSPEAQALAAATMPSTRGRSSDA